MEDHPGVGASPNISSVLKPPRPRIPLRDLLSTAYDEDNTAVRKRRVSFSNVNKIKEFSSGAESMVVCQTPVYEEPFSMSSDSSCPSGAEGWTPVKTNSTFTQNNEGAMTFTDQKENVMQCLPTMGMSGIYVPSDIASEDFTDGMEFTSCISHYSKNRCSTRFSMGMDLTNVVEQNMNYSAEGLNLTKAASLETEINTSGANLVHNESLDNSSALEFTEVINNPILSGIFTNTDVCPFKSPVYSVNNSRYSVNGMDLTQAAISRRSSVRRMSTRYSLSGMDLTEAIDNNHSALELTRYSLSGMDLREAIDNNHSALELTEGISGPRTASTRYSANGMELTENIQKDFITRSIDRTDVVGDRLDYSADIESSVYFTKPIHNIYQSTIDRSEIPSNCMEFTEVVGINERRKSLVDNTKFEPYNEQESFGMKNSVNVTELKHKQENTILLEKSSTALSKHETSSSYKPIEVLTHVQNPMNAGIMKPKTGHFSCMERPTANCNDNTSNVLIDSNIKEIKKTITNDKIQMRCNELKYNNTDDCKIQGEKNIDDIDIVENLPQDQSFNVPTEEIEKEPLVEPIIENDLPNSTNDSMRNITMTRGGCKRAISTLPTPQESFLDSGREDSLIRGRTDQTSMLEAMIQQLDLNQTPSGEADQSKLIESLSFKKAKGGKRSFEMALEPENDTEESPVKQICLPDAIHSIEGDFLLNTTAPSFLMHSLNAPNITIPSLHQSEITSTSKIEKAIENKLSVTLNSGTTQECNLPKDEKRSAHGIHFSLRLDISTKCEQEISVDDNHDSMDSKTQMRESYEKNEESINVQDESIVPSLSKNSCELERSSSIKNKSDFETDDVSESSASRSTVVCESIEKQKDVEGSILKDSMETSQTEMHESNEEKEQSVNVKNELSALNLLHDSCGLERSSSFKDESHIETDDMLESPSSKSTSDGESAKQQKDKESFILKDSIMETSQTQTHEGLEDKEQSTNVQSESTALNLPQNSFGLGNSLSFKDESAIEHDDMLESPASKSTIGRDCVEKHKDKESSILKDSMEINQTQVHESYEEKEHSINVQNDSITLTLNLSDSSGFKKSSSSKDESDIEIDDVSNSPAPRTTMSWKSTEKHKDKNSCIPEDEFNFNQFTGAAISHPSNRYTIGANLVEKCNYNSNENTLQNREFIKQRAKSTLFTKPHLKIQNLVNVRGYSFDSQDPMEIISRCKKIRRLDREVFACDLIPKWIEMQFSVESGSITNPSYKLICREREKNLVGEYILQHIKFARTHVTDLVLELESPNDTFSSRLVKNLSLICKYHNGRMKGNVLTIEVVNCRRHFWATVDVNLKYPKFLSPMDITISKQTIGELKLSEVRQIFSSIEKGQDQLYNFAEELSKLRF